MFGYFWTEKLGERKPGIMCPEIAERCLALDPKLILPHDSKAILKTPNPYLDSIVRLVHDDEYVDFVKNAYKNKERSLDSGDTRVTHDIFEQALLSASSGCRAVDAICRGEMKRAFCVVRPPGHHANARRALGFCVFNNVAVAARHAQARMGVERVLTVDWDVHPGNGTQEVFWKDPSVFTLSFHEKGQFGASGSPDKIGVDEGKGFCLNVHFEKGTDRKIFVNTFRETILEVADSFRPEFIIISAGFDAHKLDIAAKQELLEEDYAEMTHIVRGVANEYAQGRLLSVLEGGYSVPVLARCVAAHCAAME